MTLSVPLSPEIEAKLRQRAAAAGKDATSLASEIIAEAVSRPTADELLAPARKQVAASGMSDAGLDDFLHGVVKDVRAEKRAGNP